MFFLMQNPKQEKYKGQKNPKKPCILIRHILLGHRLASEFGAGPRPVSRLDIGVVP